MMDSRDCSTSQNSPHEESGGRYYHFSGPLKDYSRQNLFARGDLFGPVPGVGLVRQGVSVSNRYSTPNMSVSGSSSGSSREGSPLLLKKALVGGAPASDRLNTLKRSNSLKRMFKMPLFGGTGKTNSSPSQKLTIALLFEDRLLTY